MEETCDHLLNLLVLVYMTVPLDTLISVDYSLIARLTWREVVNADWRKPPF